MHSIFFSSTNSSMFCHPAVWKSRLKSPRRSNHWLKASPPLKRGRPEFAESRHLQPDHWSYPELSMFCHRHGLVVHCHHRCRPKYLFFFFLEKQWLRWYCSFLGTGYIILHSHPALLFFWIVSGLNQAKPFYCEAFVAAFMHGTGCRNR